MSPELRLVLASAATVPSEAAKAFWADLASGGLNWDEVLELAAAHRVRPALLKNLGALLPPSYLARMEQACEAISAHNRFLASELCSVMQMLEACGVQAIAFKGPVFAQQVCGDITLAEFADLDLLVPRELAWLAVETLEGQGYHCEYAAGNWRRPVLLDLECEVTLAHPAGHAVDLHWDFTAPYYRPFPITLPVETVEVHVLGSPLRTLTYEDAALFAIGHLSRHGFWIAKETAQIASILGSFQTLDWDRMLERSSRQGCRRMALFAVAAAAEFHQAQIPETLAKTLSRERHWLNGALARSKRSFDGAASHPPSALPRLAMRLSHLDSIGQRAGHMARFLFTPRPAVWSRLPWAGLLAGRLLRGPAHP